MLAKGSGLARPTRVLKFRGGVEIDRMAMTTVCHAVSFLETKSEKNRTTEGPCLSPLRDSARQHG